MNERGGWKGLIFYLEMEEGLVIRLVIKFNKYLLFCLEC